MSIEESRAHRALRNSAWNMAGYAAPILVAAFTTPIIVFGLGEHDYGVYAFLISLIGALGVIELGLSSAASKYVTELHATRDGARLRSSFETANSLGLIIGFVGLVACLAIGIGGHALVAGSIAPQTAWYYAIVGAVFFVNSASLAFGVVPNALQRFDVSMKVNTLTLATSAVANVIAVKSGGGVGAMLLIQLAVSLFMAIFYRAYALRALPGEATLSFSFSRVEARRLYSFGTRAFMANVGNALSTYLGRLIIPIFLGPSALTYYSVPGNVASKVPGVTGAISTVLFPIAAGLSSLGEEERIKIVYVRSFRLITVLAAAAASSVIFFSEHILRYWMSEEFAARSTQVLILLTLTNFMLALYQPLYHFLLGIGRTRMIIAASFSMAAINAATLFALVPRLGISGAAWAYLASVLPIAYMIYHTERTYLKLGFRGRYYLALGAKVAVAAGASYLATTYVWLPLTTSFPALLVTGPMSVVTYLAAYKLFGFFEPEDWRDMTAIIKKVS